MNFGNINPRGMTQMTQEVPLWNRLENSLKKNQQGRKGLVLDPKSVWVGLVPPTRHRCLDYIGDKEGLCLDLVEMIQEVLVKKNHKNCVEKYHRVVEWNDHLERQEINQLRGLPHFLRTGKSPKYGLNPISWRHDLKNTGIRHLWIGGLKMTRESIYEGDRDLGYQIEFEGTKKEIVEVMKGHGMKFNKSKKKSELVSIFIKGLT